MTYTDIIENISNAMESCDGEEVARIHNNICSSKIEYDKDNQWIKIEDDECLVDSDGCLIDNDGDAETDLE